MHKVGNVATAIVLVVLMQFNLRCMKMHLFISLYTTTKGYILAMYVALCMTVLL